MSYQLRHADGSLGVWTPGKVVCVTRNYAAHAAELGNPVPAEPVFFIKPPTALTDFAGPLKLPQGQGSVHHEVEMGLVVGRRLTRANDPDFIGAIAGFVIALDLTLRDLQSQLKRQGLPWEAAKGFAGACPVGPFIEREALPDFDRCEISLALNGEQRQHGNTADMLFDVPRLLAEATARFTLEPGDILLTGTPPGVGPLEPGDCYEAQLGTHRWTGRVDPAKSA